MYFSYINTYKMFKKLDKMHNVTYSAAAFFFNHIYQHTKYNATKKTNNRYNPSLA